MHIRKISEGLVKSMESNIESHVLSGEFLNIDTSKLAVSSNDMSRQTVVLANPTPTAKRVFDVVFSSLAIVMLAPVMLAIACVIKLDSRGKVLFKQKRNGLDGKIIEVWKFRSMRVVENGETVTQATQNDPRVTKIGRILRKTSLDELPQFFNVLTGAMSVVGPRPHAVAHNIEYQSKIPYYSKRHSVRPGITGWAQVNGARGETDTLEKMDERVKYDLDYINRMSLRFDMEIILKTVTEVFKCKDVY